MLKNIGIAFFIRALGAISLFIMTVFISRELPNKEAGYFFLVFSLLSILIPISVFGTNLISLKTISIEFDKKNWQEITNISIVTILIVLFFSGIISFALWLSAAILAENIWNKPEIIPVIQNSAFAITPMSLSLLIAHQLQGMGKIIKSIIILSISLPLSLSIALVTFNIENAIQASNTLILIAFLTLCLGILSLLKSIPKFKIKLTWKGSLSKLLQICSHVWIVALMAALVQWGGQFISGSWVIPEEIAYLAAAQRTAMLVSFILLAVNLVTAPKYASLYNQKKHNELRNLAFKSTYIMTACALPIVILLSVFPDFFMSFFGDEFINGSHLLVILAIGQLINVITGSVGYLLTMSGHEKDMRNIMLISSPISVIIALILIPAYGVTGAAIATAVGISIQNITMAFMVQKRLGFNIITSWIR